MENASELAIPYMATWSRQFGEFDLGRSERAGRRSLLLSRACHLPMASASIQGQGASGAQPSARLAAFVLANNLVRGLRTPAPGLCNVPLQPKDPWHTALVGAGLFRLLRPYGSFSPIPGAGRDPAARRR